LLRNYFPDKQPEAVFSEHNGWEVRLAWPSAESYYKDSKLSTGVQALFDTDALDNLSSLRGIFGSISVSLCDSWTLLEWSSSLAHSEDTRPLVIIHVDAHSDLMAPLLKVDGSSLFDLITGAEVNIALPASVDTAIRSGAIGIGSFLVPFLWQENCETLVHLCPNIYSPDIRGWGLLEKTTVADDLLAPATLRPMVRRNVIAGSGTSRHLVAETLRDSHLELHGKQILLHIDLDYFNNRYNGDSHWHEQEDRHDPPVTDMLEAVERLFVELTESGMEEIAHLMIACSPEFCPAEYWEPLIERINQRFSNLVKQVDRP
jgi:hypothetical protein